MKGIKVLSVLLTSLVLLSVCSFALPSIANAAKGQVSTTEVDNAAILEQDLKSFLRKNEIDPETVAFGYFDFNRELRYTFNGERLFAASDAIKFPLAYLYFQDLVTGKHHLNEDIGEDNLRAVFLRSLTKDFGHDKNATDLLIERYGGLEAVKKAMYELTYSKVDDGFYDSDALTAEYALDFLNKYYTEAMYCSTDFKHMLIDPIRQFSPGRYSETYIYDYKVTHRYGLSRDSGAVVDMGIANASYPFGFVISVEGGKDSEEEVALLAEFISEWNEEYGSLRLSQMTTLPDVAENEKKTYDATKVTYVPLMIIVIASTVLIAATVTTIIIVSENKKKNQDRLD